jgi:hypothetical protein
MKFDNKLANPINNKNVNIPGSMVYSSKIENLDIPPNGPFPISYFSKNGDQLDNKLISFLKNNPN